MGSMKYRRRFATAEGMNLQVTMRYTSIHETCHKIRRILGVQFRGASRKN